MVDEAATAFVALWATVPARVHAVPAAAGVRASHDEDYGVAVTTLPHGDAVGEVLKAARDLHTDTLVIGFHRGETAAETGRVAPHLLERAPCAVLTVPV
jgi:nucleotide-binding universal stress UspA family protein